MQDISLFLVSEKLSLVRNPFDLAVVLQENCGVNFGKTPLWEGRFIFQFTHMQSERSHDVGSPKRVWGDMKSSVHVHCKFLFPQSFNVF
jgi:hypothetical protein